MTREPSFEQAARQTDARSPKSGGAPIWSSTPTARSTRRARRCEGLLRCARRHDRREERNRCVKSSSTPKRPGSTPPRASAGRDRRGRNRQSDRDRRDLSRPDQSRARGAGGRVSHPRPFHRVACRQADVRRESSTISWPSSARTGWSSTTPNSTCASSTRNWPRSGATAIAPSASSTRWRWRGASIPASPNNLDALVRSLSHRPLARGSGTARCSTRKFWSRSMAN